MSKMLESSKNKCFYVNICQHLVQFFTIFRRRFKQFIVIAQLSLPAVKFYLVPTTRCVQKLLIVRKFISLI